MARSSDSIVANGGMAQSGPGFWLRVTAALLAVLNGVALFLYLDPPGGSRRELTEESLQVRNEIKATRASALRLKTVAAKVQLGSTQSSQFESVFFLPRRVAYQRVIEELQRMATASGMQERDTVFTSEPIEGTADLTLLNASARFEGTYDSFLHFLYEVDRTPMLLMLDRLQAAPQQTGGRINSELRFQAIIREDGSEAGGGQP